MVERTPFELPPGPVAVLGGTGFVGKALLAALRERSGREARVLVHRSRPDWLASAGAKIRTVELGDPASIRAAVAGCAIAINLLRPDGSGWFRDACARLADALPGAGLARYLHVSSIDVYGSTPAGVVTEDTPIDPRTPYEREHAAAADAILAMPLDVGIVRLGAVFGLGGANLAALAHEAQDGPWWRLALRRALYGRRRMHLVSVGTVAEGLRFLACDTRALGGARFLLIEDAASENDFAHVQDRLLAAFGRTGVAAVPALPPGVLALVLRLSGRSNTDPMRRFEGGRLVARGFAPSTPFAASLQVFVDHLAEGERTCP